MPVPTTFLDTCRTRVLALAELTAYQTAGALADSASRADRDAQWGAMHAGGNDSPAHRLRLAVRGVVSAEADVVAASTGTVVTAAERNACYDALVSEYAPARPRPVPAADELAALNQAIAEDQRS